MADVWDKLVWAVGGSAASLLGAYWVIARDLAYLKGQLATVLNHLGVVTKLGERVTAQEIHGTKTQADVHHAFEKIRHLERRRTDGDRNGAA